MVQAELTALVQTYRFFQTAAYRREKYRLAQQLADFNDRLPESLQRRMEANQVATPPTWRWHGSRAGRPGSWSRRPGRII